MTIHIIMNARSQVALEPETGNGGPKQVGIGLAYPPEEQRQCVDSALAS